MSASTPASASAASSNPDSIPSNFALNFLPIAGAILFLLECSFAYSAYSMQDKYDSDCERRYFGAYDTMCDMDELEECDEDSKCSVYDEYGEYTTYWGSTDSYYCPGDSESDSCCGDYRCNSTYAFLQIAITLCVFKGVGIFLEVIRMIMCAELADSSHVSEADSECCVSDKSQHGPCVLGTVGDSLFFRCIVSSNSTVWSESMVLYQKRSTFYECNNSWCVLNTLFHTLPVWITAFVLFLEITDVDEDSVVFWLAIILKLAIFTIKIGYRDNRRNCCLPPAPAQPRVQVPVPVQVQMPDGELLVEGRGRAIQDQNAKVQVQVQMADAEFEGRGAIENENENADIQPSAQVQMQAQPAPDASTVAPAYANADVDIMGSSDQQSGGSNVGDT